MTSDIAAPAAGGFVAAVDGGAGVVAVVRVLFEAGVNASCDSPAGPGVLAEHAATRADAAIRTAIRMFVRLAGHPDASGEARRPGDRSLTSVHARTHRPRHHRQRQHRGLYP